MRTEFYQHKESGLVKNYDTVLSPIWCFIFGPFYWLYRKNYLHMIASLLIAIVTFGVSHFIYPFFANIINRKAYKSDGFEPVYYIQPKKDKKTNPGSPWWRPKFNARWIAFVIVAAFLIVFFKNMAAPIDQNGSTLYQMVGE